MSCRWSSLALASLVLASLTSAPAAVIAEAPSPAPTLALNTQPTRFAVVIGNNQSLGRRRPDLHFADDDAARYSQIFETMAPGRVSMLTAFDRDTAGLFPELEPHSRPATRSALEALGRELALAVAAARAAGQDTELYFVFAGHGDVAQGEGFLELTDARFYARELEAWLSAIPFTRAHVILDSCNSFFMLGVRKPGGRHFATSEDAVRALSARLPNVGVFLSTSAEGEAFEWSEIQSGIFSHVVRSGLMGAADGNGDGVVNYLELAAFVGTATLGVRNPNMRPHVFARGPGAADETAIASLQSMSSVRRLALGELGARLRLRDASGLPLLDAHPEAGHALHVAVPEAWAVGASVERSRGEGEAQHFSLLPTSELVALSPSEPRSAARGPDETFRALFSQPFGPRALARYASDLGTQRPPVYGVSSDDAERMELVLDQISRSQRSQRVTEGIGGLGFGALLIGAGVGVLNLDPEPGQRDLKRTRRIAGALIASGSLLAGGGLGALLVPGSGEQAARDFRRVRKASGDPAQAFAAADERLRALTAARRAERLAGGLLGSLTLVGATTGLVVSEFVWPSRGRALTRRLGWGAGMLAGLLMLADAAMTETPSETLTRIWREDPALHRFQPSLSIERDGCSLVLSGAL